MGADLSRVRFDGRQDHSGVVMQQGRVLLDADWNELVASIDRRLRAQAADLGSPGPTPGIAGVAVVPRTTPDAFRLSFAGTALMIGRGRMYVDGICAENHGLTGAEFEPLLEGQRGTADTPYTAQPYWPVPAPLPTTGTHLAYLDVWHREVTVIEEPGLAESALGGPDTTGRTQVAWRVRLHDVTGAGVTCLTPDADIPGWADLIAPSGARLTVGTIPVTDTDDPCALPPSGGYRGLENQTYRIEVHTAGGLGTATFTWSRDNASVASPVVEVLAGGLGVRPASLGKDVVLGFADGDWVEILDDQRELTGQPGEIRLAEVHEEDGTLTFTPSLPADLQLSVADAAKRHLRVRRWDQKGQIKSGSGGNLDNLTPGSSGVITVPASSATTVVLEHGVTVSFSGSNFKVGDHWVFAARTADTSVEQLTAAPPLGTHHHYARLGVVTFPGSVTHCPHDWPPDCECDGDGCSDCTVCVTPESHAGGSLTIQMAVDQVVAAGGGIVCLRPGTFLLDESGVVIDAATSVTVRGVGPRSVVVTRGTGFSVTGSAFVSLEDLSVIASGRTAVDARATIGLTVQRLTVLDIARVDVPAAAIRLAGVSLATTLRENIVIGPRGIESSEEDVLLTAELRIEENTLICREGAIRLVGGHLFSNAIRSNTILRCEVGGIHVPGLIAPGHGFEISDNSLYVQGFGIAVGASGFTVDDNDVTGVGEGSDVAYGIALTPSPLGDLRGTTRVSRNRVTERATAAIALGAALSEVTISDNEVSQVPAGIATVRGGSADAASVRGNLLTDLAGREGNGLGIALVGVSNAHVEGNQVLRVAQHPDALLGIGIVLVGCPVARVSGNGVDQVGTVDRVPPSLGIGVTGAFDSAQVAGNTVRRQPVAPDDDQRGPFTGLVIGQGEADVDGLLKKVGLTGLHAVLAAIGGPSAATVEGNVVWGNGEMATARISIGEGEAVVGGNQFLTAAEGASALSMTADAGTVATNRLRGGRPSAALTGNPKQYAVVGNITSSGIEINGGPLDPTWLPLNPDGVF